MTEVAKQHRRGSDLAPMVPIWHEPAFRWGFSIHSAHQPRGGVPKAPRRMV